MYYEESIPQGPTNHRFGVAMFVISHHALVVAGAGQHRFMLTWGKGIGCGGWGLGFKGNTSWQ